MVHKKRIYLAGPEVFFSVSEHQAIVAEKKRLLAAAGLEGIDPLDSDLALDPNLTKREHGFQIYRANRELMGSCDGIIANLTPFRGVSADPGTVFEVGYMIGQGKLSLGFTLDSRRYFERAGGVPSDERGHIIENFDLSDNLMIECGLEDSGGMLVKNDRALSDGFFSSALFEQCVVLMARKFND
jgi:nucleoside 2-deoxyribosyltransferase